MFTQRHNYYKVEESSMEEFLSVIRQQKSKSSHYEISKINYLEKKFMDAFSKDKQS